MTDDATPPDYLPEPRPTSDKVAEREAALQELAGQSAPAVPPGAASVLTDRVLLHTSWDTGSKLLPVLPEHVGGLVLRGAGAATGIKHLSKAGFDRPIAYDPEGYAVAAATEDDPFVLRPADGGLFGLTLEQELQRQRDFKACVALTPTGYLHAGDSDALRAAVRAAGGIDDDDVVFSVPLDVGWFQPEHIDHLIAVLALLELPKAVFIGGHFDPLERYKDAVANLRRLVAEAGHVAVLRTDLTGFDVMSHGAFATSIGSGGSLRHMNPLGQIRRSKKDDKSPSVLFGDLMSFFKGSTLYEKFADSQAPVCDCASCDGRELNTFLTKDDSIPAHRHGLCTWADWIPGLHACRTLADRATWWRTQCVDAVANAEIVNTRINQPEAFKPPETLRAWAELPSWLSAIHPVTRRPRAPRQSP
ncbi:hypothetical protein [Amycolatopsis sp. cmx-4-68]|uniref:hypothetical protein n=1 Tax=Amycolatopsis sp. cmx-4-68 TaxID=2790938 RepID=UPI003978EF65